MRQCSKSWQRRRNRCFICSILSFYRLPPTAATLFPSPYLLSHQATYNQSNHKRQMSEHSKTPTEKIIQFHLVELTLKLTSLGSRPCRGSWQLTKPSKLS